jgi:hypothetical protein
MFGMPTARRNLEMTDFSDLDTDPMSAVSQQAKSRESAKPTFPCIRCGGTGRYTGARVHQTASECFSCGGTGKVKMDPYKARAANAKRKATIQRNLEDGIAAVRKEHGDLIAWLSENTHWNDFARSLIDQLFSKGRLSEGQINAAYRIREKTEAKRAEKAAAKIVDAPKVDISVIEALFGTAHESGLKKPKLRAYGVQISEAPAHGRNAGALYVKHRGEYAGKIVSGRFMATSVATEETRQIVEKLAADPKGFTAKAGRDTGICCCCGRELTDPVSVANGIGPICAENWGF